MASPEQPFVKSDSAFRHYNCGEIIGQGTFGTVRHATRILDQTEWAMKIMDQNRLTKEDIEGLISEISIVKHIQHDNIVRVLECFDDGTSQFIMIMELMRGGELLDRIITRKVYSEKNAAEVIRDVANALEYCHSRNIAHRDVKPENLLLVSEDSENVKLADFGFAKVRVAKDSLNTACGTPGYAAPELLTRKKQKNYSLKVDMWSVGVVLYILLCGFPPFHEENTSNLYRKILKGSYTFPPKYFSRVSDGAKDLVRKLLIVKPEDRLSASEVLAHPWIQSQCKMDVKDSVKLNTVPAELTKYVGYRKKAKLAMTKIRVMNLMTARSANLANNQEAKDTEKNGASTSNVETTHTNEESTGTTQSNLSPKHTAKIAPEGEPQQEKTKTCTIL